MDHAPSMLATLVMALALALAFGVAARALRLPPLFGYLVAGVMVGPYTPGFVADAALTEMLAEVGVGLLLFGVGLHFRLQDLLAVWRVAVPGALAQVALGTAIGLGVGMLGFGLAPEAGLVFGLMLAIASTAVATRSLERSGNLTSEAGRIALGWLVMQDLVAVLALVLVPAMAGAGLAELPQVLGRSLLELLAFGASVLLLGRRGLPWALAHLARSGSRELFTLGVIVAALGVSFGAAAIFHVSFALGAFFAGMLLGESDLGHEATAEVMPLQRVFAALFFVSVGMLLDPRGLLQAPIVSVAALLAVLLGTGAATFGVLLLLRVEAATAAIVAGAMAQIGEFSFLLGKLAVVEKVLPASANAPVIAAAFGAILLTPLSQHGLLRVAGWLGQRPRWRSWQAAGQGPAIRPPEGAVPPGHAILVGYGRVGRVVAAALRRHGLPVLVVEADRRVAEAAMAAGLPVLWGDAARPEVMQAARPAEARLLVLALPDAVAAQRMLQLARHGNPGILAAARAHDDVAMAALAEDGNIGLVVMGEREIALGIADFALVRLGIEAGEAQRTIEALRMGEG
ncbi:cation:proton antiporter [Siccirubricoccus phaeus]|uniref:cation:proton antiporter n=1 Tax=Siccirubricoccus phaeus TaxID=2595053 RepID=UPI0011F0B7B8|nr:cation:proton antiporter [Siccirubricoccus phaeus]